MKTTPERPSVKEVIAFVRDVRGFTPLASGGSVRRIEIDLRQ